jgi:hypothetical protein
LPRRLSHLISRSDAHKHIVRRAGTPQLLIFVATSSGGLVAPMYVRVYAFFVPVSHVIPAMGDQTKKAMEDVFS